MGEVFIKLLNMSITTSWLILAVLFVRLLFRKIPKWITCLLWGVVAIRLIFPFSIESVFSLQPSAEPIRTSTMVEGEVMPYVPSIDSNLGIVENAVNPLLAETFAYSEMESVAPLQIFTGIAGSVWLCGMVGLLIFAAVSMVRLRLCVREAVRYKENIYICDAVKSPFILGIVKPRIYLPSALNEDEMDYIIAHEKAHLRRKDYLWKPFGYLLLCIYWFNPLCWIAYIMLCKDIELACDEKVIKDMSFGDKKEYSRVLLSCATQRRLVLACPLAFGEIGVKERVKTVLNYKKPAFWITIAAIVVCVIVAICFLTNPQKEYQIRITIPAGSTADFCYSDEEISPNGNTLTLANGDGLGDTEVLLKPIEVKEENAYEPTYMTPGMPLKMDVEKGAWFKIGVNMQNPTLEDIYVYVSVRDVEVRIASEEENDNAENVQESEQAQTGISGVDELYSLQNTYKVNLNHDVDGSADDHKRTDTLEVYTRNMDNGDSGIVLIYSGNANNPYSVEAHTTRAGWKGIYLISEEDKDYLFELQLDIREGFGELRYWVNFFSEQVGPNPARLVKDSMEFVYEQSDFNEVEFDKWTKSMEKYLENAELLLSTQDGELRIGPGNDYERYQAEALRKMIEGM